MGTNYYHISDTETEQCCECGHEGPKRRHIGKSSAGWCFALHVIPEDGINTLDDWCRVWESGRIKDEYGNEISPADMLYRITERGRPGRTPWAAADLAANSAVPGPNGLARHAIGRYCVGHGEGTWDYMPGNFS